MWYVYRALLNASHVVSFPVIPKQYLMGIIEFFYKLDWFLHHVKPLGESFTPIAMPLLFSHLFILKIHLKLSSQSLCQITPLDDGITKDGFPLNYQLVWVVAYFSTIPWSVVVFFHSSISFLHCSLVSNDFSNGGPLLDLKMAAYVVAPPPLSVVQFSTSFILASSLINLYIMMLMVCSTCSVYTRNISPRRLKWPISEKKPWPWQCYQWKYCLQDWWAHFWLPRSFSRN